MHRIVQSIFRKLRQFTDDISKQISQATNWTARAGTIFARWHFNSDNYN